MADQFNILDYTDGPLLKTGQQNNLTPAGRTSQDDGGNQNGIHGSFLDNQYIVLTTDQYNGTTAITVNAIVDNHSNNCVFDKVTGLMWNRESSKLIYGTGAQGLLWDDTAGNNEDIFEYCDQANASALSGFTDWRVPNIRECFSILSFESVAAGATVNQTVFPTIANVAHWSSTSVPLTFFQNTNGVTINYGGLDQISFSLKTNTRLRTLLCRLGANIG